MIKLPFGELPPYQPRKFVPATANLGDWNQVEALYRALEEALSTAQSPVQLERFLLNWGELGAALDQEGSQRYIAMTCHTDDPAIERHYLSYIQEIEPLSKPQHFRLSRLYLDHPHRPGLPQPRFAVFDRHTRVAVDLYREKNVELETRETCLAQQYQKRMGSLTVNFGGQERTLAQMGRYLEETDRSVRQEAWELVARRRLQEADALDQLFEELLDLRWQLADNAGFTDPRDYFFRRLGRVDYTPDDCLRFHAAVEDHVLPLLRELQARRREHLGLATLRPWDLAVDPLNHPPLRPFAQVDELVAKTQSIIDALDPHLAANFRQLHRHRLLDLDNRKGKGPGGYQSSLAEARLPFIFMNAVGQQRDVETLLHEAGHAFHALACAAEDFYPYRSNIPIEFCEVASMTMELLGNEFLEVFYPPTNAQRARRIHLEGILQSLAWIATIDAFQHWLYTHPNPSPQKRNRAWIDLLQRFEGDIDWSGLTSIRTRIWHRQLHLFLYPFYYIEYGIAQLGALQLWARFRRDRPATLQAYRDALALGGSEPLPILFERAGCQFDFSPASLQPLMTLVQAELDRSADPQCTNPRDC
jgi:oligoendopeptidase F